MRLRRLASLFGGFTLSTIIMGIAGLVIVPVIVHYGGNQAWSAVAVGQSMGLLGTVVVGYGWAISGPVMVARLTEAEAAAEYPASAAARLLLAVPAIAIGSGLALWVSPHDPSLCALAYVGAALVGLSNFYFYVGRQEGTAFLICETLPRALGTTTAILILAAGQSVAVALAVLAAGPVVGFIITSWDISRRSPGAWSHPSLASRVRSALWAQRHGLLTNVGVTAFFSLPVIVVGAVSPSALTVYSLVDKLLKQALSAISPVLSVLQGWVPRAESGAELLRRVKLAVVGALAAAALVFVGFAATGQVVMRLLSAGSVEMTVAQLLSAAALFGLVVAERIVGRSALLSLNGAAWLTLSTYAGAVVGLALLVPALLAFGATGAILAVATGLTSMGALEIWGCSRSTSSATLRAL